jgi:hypothetical protein
MSCAVFGAGFGAAHADKGGGGHGGGGGSSGSGSSGSGSSGSGSSGSGSSGGGDGSSSLSQSEQAEVRQAVASGEAQSLGDIIPALHKAAPGRILNISFRPGSGGYIYVFAVLTNAGRIFDVSVDAKTGMPISIKGR